VTQATFRLPRPRELARHAFPHVVEGAVVPLVLFYVILRVVGVWPALWVSLGWVYLGLGRRAVRGQRLPGLLLLGAVGLTIRTVTAWVTGSTFIYFFQPTLTTVAIAGAFLLSVRTRQPLALRLATDLFPLPDALLRRPAIANVFRRITLLWGTINLISAAVTMWLLVAVPVGTFVLSRFAVTSTITLAGIGLSFWWFKRALREPVPGPAALPAAH
jgi:hypothetical protein